MAEFTIDYHGETCDIIFSHYVENDNVAIALRTKEGFPFATATVNLINLPGHQVAIKNWSENEGMDEALIEAGIIKKDRLDETQSGFVVAPVYELTEEAIAEKKRRAFNN